MVESRRAAPVVALLLIFLGCGHPPAGNSVRVPNSATMRMPKSDMDNINHMGAGNQALKARMQQYMGQTAGAAPGGH